MGVSVPSIIISGASGALGRDLTPILSTRYPAIELVRSNYNNLHELKGNIEGSKHTYLIHLSSATPNNVGKRDYYDYMQNVVSLDSIVNYIAKKTKYLHIIFASAISVYKVSNEQFEVKESDELVEGNNYGSSKRVCEDLLRKHQNSQLINSFVCLRLPAILSRTAHLQSKNFIINTIIAMRTKQRISLYNQYGYYNNLITSGGISNFILSLISKGKLPNRSLNVAAYPPVKMHQLINHIAARTEYCYPIEWNENKRPCFYINTESARQHGFKPDSVYGCINEYLEKLYI